MTAEAALVALPELDQGDPVDYRYTGDSITQESLRSIPRLQVTRGETLSFIQELLVGFLLEDLPSSQLVGDETSESNDLASSIRSCVEGLIRLFFCGDEYASKCQDTQAGIDKIISIMSIPASEGSCERSLSRQKESWDIHASIAVAISFERDLS
jgi:hypothetical protein